MREKYTLIFLYIFLPIILSEFFLRVFAAIGLINSFRERNIINFEENSELGYKIMPNKFPGIDEFGFRNTDVNINHVKIFAIGDSQTYGVNADNNSGK